MVANGNIKNKKDKLPDGKSKRLGEEALQAYAKAVIALQAVQAIVLDNMQQPARGTIVENFLSDYDRENAVRKRKEYEDRGINTLNDGYTLDELKLVSRYQIGRNTPHYLRDRLDFLLGHAILGRGETKRVMQLPYLLCTEFKDEGPHKCIALVITMNKGKTNQHGRVEYGYAIRHRYAEVCPIGALAFHLFSRWHIENEEFPDFTSCRHWHDIHVSKGANRIHAITYNTQRMCIKNRSELLVFDQAK